MAYDEELAARIRKALSRKKGITEKEMFGGIAFMLDTKMFVGVIKDDLMVRVGKEGHASAVKERHVRPMDFTGRPMVGYVYVSVAGLKDDDALKKWIRIAADHVATLPEKKPKKPKRSR
jgi:TfoX/Sxy family transcriptional regulator of competence genes